MKIIEGERIHHGDQEIREVEMGLPMMASTKGSLRHATQAIRMQESLGGSSHDRQILPSPSRLRDLLISVVNLSVSFSRP